MRVEIGTANVSEEEVGMKWCIHLGMFGRIYSKEFGRGHPDDSERQIVDLDGLADRTCRISETPAAAGEAQNRDGRRALAIVSRVDQPSRCGRDAQRSEIFA